MEERGKWHGHTSSEVKTRYNRKAYDEVRFRVRKGQKEAILIAADQAGMSVTEYLCAAITAYGCPVTSKVSGDNNKAEQP